MNVTTLNPAAVQMFRLSGNFRGLLGSMLAHSPEWENVHRALQKFLESPQQFQKHETAVFLTNKEWNFRLVYVPLFQDKEWNGAVVLIEDISDIIRSNRLSAWAEMARRVAHEVKNPLTPIQLAMEHLVKVYEDHSQNFESTLKTCSAAVLKQVKALRRLVSDFSQYGREAVLNPTEVDLKKFLSELIENYDSHLPTGIEMESRIDPNLPKVQMDQEKIRGALMNIIENGLQAMNGEGKMMVRASKDNGFVKIEIQDSGRGVPPELLPKLFEPYFSTKTGGTGLGLSIARKSVEDHGGKIEVESEPQQGTRVTILLPEEPAPHVPTS
jgi:two-component system nitrogen regulation sensor histidine kinase NtrY